MAAPLGVDPREVFDEVANSFHDCTLARQCTRRRTRRAAR